MANYLSIQIELGKLKYNDVVAKYSQYKTDIDTKLKDDGWEINVSGNCVAAV